MKRFLAFGLLFATSAFADQICQSIYNPMTGEWEYQCVDRDRGETPYPPKCHQEYDAMNGTWVTVCD